MLCVIAVPVINAQNGDEKEDYISLGLLVNKQNEAALKQQTVSDAE